MSIRERINSLFQSIDWLATTTIPVCGDGYRYEDVLDFETRWQCFLGSIETAIIGYLYGIEPD